MRLAAGANALETAAAVRARVDELARFFPPGLKAVYPLDTTPFVRLSIREVLVTLAEAIVLVFLVMFLFLQNFRATLIAVPVVLLGTFGVLAAAGFGVNTLTIYAAQQLLIQARLARLANLVDLYRALGGGWWERAAPGTGDASARARAP